MEIYSTEEQQVDAIKRFWKEHGNGIIVGTLIGLAGIYGWRWYGEHEKAQQEATSASYEEVVKKVDGGDLAAGDAFLATESAGQYQSLMAARLAKKAVEASELDKALGYLDQALSHSKDENLNAIFTLRKARIQLAKGDAAAAKASVELVKNDAFNAEAQELLGDIAVKEGDLAAARTAYQQALTGQAGAPALQLKLESLDSKG
ncbi:YfgM family protein [Gallaecimonas xiamenensis]|uniref:Ancillary SecYEG translocon subunit n=1 Tax=Gallaecimonas xiamenensis 3-C-1 TaxID=745411 RepID=K2KC69_9GAMM|nr:tetratricopeptide repeat protein [Gallaecimonas xiamenensis]EKE74950.1 hypothetical protein B3C1_08681 [Gallaecimonas xiamenensis 3-C-1]